MQVITKHYKGSTQWLKKKLDTIQHCVYVDYRKDTMQPIYVGYGVQGVRPFSIKYHNAEWVRIHDQVGIVTHVVESGLQEWYAQELEREWILRIGKENLINISDGGGVGASTPEILNQMSQSMRANWEQKQGDRIRAGKRKQVELKQPHLSSRTYVLFCHTNGKHYPNQVAASLDLGISQGNLSRHLRGELSNVKGYRFERVLSTARINAKKIRCKTDGLEFESIRAAAKHYGVTQSNISGHLHGKTATVKDKTLVFEFV